MDIRNILSPCLLLDKIRERKKERGRDKAGGRGEREREYVCSYGKQYTAPFLSLPRVDGARWSASFGLLTVLPRTVTQKRNMIRAVSRSLSDQSFPECLYSLRTVNHIPLQHTHTLTHSLHTLILDLTERISKKRSKDKYSYCFIFTGETGHLDFFFQGMDELNNWQNFMEKHFIFLADV